MWLTILILWAVLSAWMLWSRVRIAPTHVPFVQLWRGTTRPIRGGRLFTLPPLAIWAVLLAIAAAIFGAAGPAMRRDARAGVTVIIDRGITMSAGGRLAEVIETARQAMARETLATFAVVPPADVKT